MSDVLGRWWRAFKRFWHSRDALVYLSFVLLATIIWFTNAFSTRREVTIIMPVTYTHIPDDYIFATPPTDHVRVSVEDEGIDLFRNRKRRYTLAIDMTDYIHGEEGTFMIPMDEVRTVIVQQLVGDAGLAAFAPEVLTGTYTRQHEKTVPVVYTGQVKPAAQHQLCGEVAILPRVASVYGTEQDLAGVEQVETAWTDFEGVQDTFVTRLPLMAPKGLRVVPDSVSMQVIAEQFTERAMQLPICAPDLSNEGQVLHLFPSQVTITFRVGMAWFNKVSEGDLEANVELPQDGTDHLRVQVTNRNPHITHIRIKPEEVEYLIENYDCHSDGGSAAAVPAH